MKQFLVLGDSHTKVFSHANEKQKQFRFKVYGVGGATALGCVNPNSVTNAMQIFTQRINEITEKYDKLIIMLGEVDCGYLVWVRSARYQLTVQEQLKLSCENLFQFLATHAQTRFRPHEIIVAGSILPTIRDNTNKKYLSGARSEVAVNQEKRTELTLQYNRILKDTCKECGYHYIDITNSTLSHHGKLEIDSRFLSENPHDHHLSHGVCGWTRFAFCRSCKTVTGNYFVNAVQSYGSCKTDPYHSDLSATVRKHGTADRAQNGRHGVLGLE